MSFSADSYLVTSVLPQPNYTSGVYSKFYIVLHDIECPPGPEWAESLGGPNYLQNPAEQHSVHYVVDSDSVVQGRKETDWAWGCGSPGSKHGIHIEQAGYASFSRAQWLGSSDSVNSTYLRPNGARVTFTAQDAADMAAQMNLLAKLMADIIKRHGMTAEWAVASEAQAMVNGDSGINKQLSHARVTDWIGGTVHTDPGESYPYDVLMAKIKAVLAGGNPASSSPAAPASTPTPTPVPAPQEDELSAQDVKEIKAAVTAAVTAIPGQVAAQVAKAVEASAVKHAPVVTFLSVGGGIGEFNGNRFDPKWRGFTSKAAYNARVAELGVLGYKIYVVPGKFKDAKAVLAAGYGKQVTV